MASPYTQLIQQLKDEANAMDMTEEETKKYVREGVEDEKKRRNELEREERERKEKLEREEREKKEKLEREERAARREQEKIQSQRAHELAVLAAGGRISPASTTDSQPEEHLRRPLSAPFREEVPLDTYLKNFDATYDLYQMSPERRVRDLCLLLPQKLLAILNDLPTADRLDYKKMKEALLRATNFTPEVCRRRYVNAFPRQEESMENFVQRKERLLKDWLQLAKVPEDRTSLQEFLIWDAIQSYLPQEIASYVRVQLKDEVNLVTAARYVDEYMAHSCPGRRLADVMKQISQNGMNGSSRRPTTPDEVAGTSPLQRKDSFKRRRSPRKNRPKEENTHGQTQMQEQNGTPESATTTVQGGQGAKQNSTPQQQQQQQHKANSGPNSASPAGGQNSYKWQRSQPKGGERTHPKAMYGIQFGGEEMTDAPLYESPVALYSLLSTGQNTAPTCEGTLNGTPISILLDTGAEGIYVDRRLVPDEDLTGEVVTVQLPEGKPVHRQLCRIHLQCPYYQGEAKAIALEDAARPMYLGKVTSLGPQFDKNAYDQAIAAWEGAAKPEEKPSLPQNTALPEEECSTMSQEAEIACKVVGPNTTDQEVPEASLPAEVPLQSLHSQEEFQERQEEDATKVLTIKEIEKEGICRCFARPGPTPDVDHYVHWCFKCQLTSCLPTPMAPLGITMPSVTPPARVSPDCTGTKEPALSTMKSVLLTSVDMAAKYPGAMEFGRLKDGTVAHSLHINTRMFHSSPNDSFERYNAIMRVCLRPSVIDLPKHWDKYWLALMSVYRDSPPESTYCFPLVFGHRVRQHLKFFRNSSESDAIPAGHDVNPYILQLAANYRSVCCSALQSLKMHQKSAKSPLGWKAVWCLLDPGGKVLLAVYLAEKKYSENGYNHLSICNIIA